MSESGETVSAEQLVDELRKAKVSDLLLHTCSLFASFGYGKLCPRRATSTRHGSRSRR